VETKNAPKAALLDVRLLWAAMFHLVVILPAFGQVKFFCATNNGTITIKGYQGFTDIRSYKPLSVVLTIPDTINGLPVVSVGDRAFADHSDLISIAIPKSITQIGSCAFQSCATLTNVDIPDSVTNIGFAAFSGCHDLTNVAIPKSVTVIGNVAFSSCVNLESIIVDPLNPVYASADGVLLNKSRTWLIECPGAKAGVYTVPQGVTKISDTAFSELTRITSVTLPNSVTNIEWHAFMSCTALTNVMIGSGVTSIGDDYGWIVFKDCQKLTTIAVDPLNPVFSSVDGVLINKSRATLIKYPEGKIGPYAVPEGVTTIGTHAFSSSTHLTSVTIPNTVNAIEDNAFEGCVGVASVTMGDNVRTIGASAFSSCTNLTSVKIPNSVRNIEEGAFGFCHSLTNVIIGKNVTHIGKTAFNSCSSSIMITVDALNPDYGSKNGVLISKHPVVPSAVIKDPANGASINALWVDVLGIFTEKKLKAITVENPAANVAVPALIIGNRFEARNVSLIPGTNTISAVIEDMAGNTGNDRLDRRKSRRDKERRLAASRHAEHGNTPSVHSRMRAQPADGLLEVLERDLREVARKAVHREVRQAHRHEPRRGERLAKHVRRCDASAPYHEETRDYPQPHPHSHSDHE